MLKRVARRPFSGEPRSTGLPPALRKLLLVLGDLVLKRAILPLQVGDPGLQ